MHAYIEIVGAVAVHWFELTNSDLQSIGEFTRENVLKWTESHCHTYWVDGVQMSRSWSDPIWVGLLPVEDFHAVCGDIKIPWATEAATLIWTRCFSTSYGVPVHRAPEQTKPDVGQGNTYIEFIGAVACGRHELEPHDLHQIGEFTRENVLKWTESHTGPDWVGILPVEDCHAVCGDIEIPWATEAARFHWTKLFER
jgi:hypothetical protein